MICDELSPILTSVFSEVSTKGTLNIFVSDVTRSYFTIQPSTTNRGTSLSLANLNTRNNKLKKGEYKRN